MKRDIGIFVLLLVLCGIASLKKEWHFLTEYNLQNTSKLVGIFGIFSIGLGVVIITGGIDLSVGSVFALQGVLLAMMIAPKPDGRGWSWLIAVPLTLIGLAVLGAMHGFLIAKIRMQAFIVTLCAMLFYRGIARYVSDDSSKGFGDNDYGHLRQWATGSIYGVPMPFLILIAIAAIMWVVLHKSVYGRYLYAVGRNEDAAKYSGINTRLVIGSAYVICLVLTGISGVILSLDTNSIGATDFGNSYELYGIAAAVLGGCSLRGGEGSILGIVIGTAVLQVLQNMVNLLGIASSLNFAVMGAVIFFGVLIDQLVTQRKRKMKPLVEPVQAFEVLPVPGQPPVAGATPGAPSDGTR